MRTRARRRRGRHRRPSRLRPSAAAAAAIAATAVFGTPVLLSAAGPSLIPEPRAAAPAPPTTAADPPPSTTPQPTPVAVPPSCTDYDTAADAAAALVADPQLAAHLDTDGDGRPCEIRFAPPAAEEEEPEPATAEEECPTSGFGGVLDHVAQAGHHLADRFGIPLAAIGGVGARARTSFHPGGRALDFTVDRATGDDLAAYVLDHMDQLAVIEVIWRQRINFGSGWELMEDRGSVTSNHFDHVHISFSAEPGPIQITC